MCDILMDAQGKEIPHTYICLYDREVIADKYSGRFLHKLNSTK